jgi:hypothetical protein
MTDAELNYLIRVANQMGRRGVKVTGVGLPNNAMLNIINNTVFICDCTQPNSALDNGD